MFLTDLKTQLALDTALRRLLLTLNSSAFRYHAPRDLDGRKIARYIIDYPVPLGTSSNLPPFSITNVPPIKHTAESHKGTLLKFDDANFLAAILVHYNQEFDGLDKEKLAVLTMDKWRLFGDGTHHFMTPAQLPTQKRQNRGETGWPGT